MVPWNSIAYLVALDAISVTNYAKYATSTSSLRQTQLSIDFNWSSFLNTPTEPGGKPILEINGNQVV